MTPDPKPTSIQPAKYLSDTIAAMVKANCYCQSKLPGGAVMRYKPDVSWAIYRQGGHFSSTTPMDMRFLSWTNELNTFRRAIAESSRHNLAESWIQFTPHKDWYGALLNIVPTAKSLFEMPEVTK